MTSFPGFIPLMNKVGGEELAESFVVAIDGPSAAGKGNAGQENRAHYYDFAHLDTGIPLYRAVAHRPGCKTGQEKTEQNATEIGGPAFRTGIGWQVPRIARARLWASIASEISVFPKVRQALKEWQQEFRRPVPPGGKKGRSVGWPGHRNQSSVPRRSG